MRRKRQQAGIVLPQRSQEELKALYGRVWTVQELAREFVITAIVGHSVVVRHKADDAVGTLDYQEGPPSLYFDFKQQAEQP